jgi:L-rhamnose mutarotase
MNGEQIAFRMQLKPGCEAEYRRRHDELWPELGKALSDAGVYDYSIFLDDETLALFAVLRVRPGGRRDLLPRHKVVRRWWRSMAELMVVREDLSPVEWPLQQVFHFPGDP